MSFSSFEVDVEFLINLVQARPVIWDKESPQYHDRIKSRSAWAEICEEIHPDYKNLNDETKKKAIHDDIFKKWSNIRDAFVRSEKKAKEKRKSGSGVSNIKKYIYGDQLQFLLRPRGHRPTKDSITSAVEENTENSQDVIETTDTVETVDPVEIIDPVEDDEIQEEFEANRIARQEKRITNVPKLGSRKKPKVDAVAERMLAVLEKEEPPKLPPNRHLLFFESVLPSLSSFSDDEVLLFQADVLRLIMQIKERRMQRPLQSGTPYYYVANTQGTYSRPAAQSNYTRASSMESFLNESTERIPSCMSCTSFSPPTDSFSNSSPSTPTSLITDLAQTTYNAESANFHEMS